MGTGRTYARSRQATQMMAAALAQNGTRSTCSARPLRMRAAAHGSPLDERMSSAPDSATRLLQAMERQRRQAAVELFGPAVRLDVQIRHQQPVSLTLRLRVDHPACELLEARFEGKVGQGIEIEYPQLRAGGAVLLDEERRAARICLPGDLPRRIAVSKGTTAQPLVGPVG